MFQHHRLHHQHLSPKQGCLMVHQYYHNEKIIHQMSVVLVVLVLQLRYHLDQFPNPHHHLMIHHQLLDYHL